MNGFQDAQNPERILLAYDKVGFSLSCSRNWREKGHFGQSNFSPKVSAKGSAPIGQSDQPRHRNGCRESKLPRHLHHPPAIKPHLHYLTREHSSHFLPIPSLFPKLPLSLSKTLTFSLNPPQRPRQELAHSLEALEDTESGNRRVVLALYDALSSRDVDTVLQIVAPDLEWWFHGPPTHQFLMRLLTGSQNESFQFVPQSIASFGPTVLVEGCDRDCSISWVHAWTVASGVVTGVREYFNTTLTVTRLGNNSHRNSPASSAKSSSGFSYKSSSSAAEITSSHFPSVWESSVSNRAGKSMPGLVLAI